MQLLSLAALAPDAQRLLDDLSKKLAHDYTVEIIVFAAITLALCVVSAWIAAQAVAKDKAEVGSAMATGFRWFVGFLLGLALAGTAFYFARLRGSGTMATASLAIGGLLLLYTAINSPMQVYRIGFGKGLLFAIIGLLVQAAAQVAINKAMNDPLLLDTRLDQVRRLAALPPEDAAQVLNALKKPGSHKAAPIAVSTPPKTTPVATPPPDPTPAPVTPPKPHVKTIAERHDDLKKIYADLMAQRESLKEGDDTAIAAYTRDTALYVEKLAQLQKDADAEKK